MIIRIPTEDVVLIDRSLIEKTLSKDLIQLGQKTERIMSSKLLIVQGPWCTGCTANAKYSYLRMCISDIHYTLLCKDCRMTLANSFATIENSRDGNAPTTLRLASTTFRRADRNNVGIIETETLE